MSILEVLPPEIFRMILQFLELPEKLIPLDNAILNHRLRSFYLQAIDGMTIKTLPYLERSKCVAWMLNKNILPTRLRFPEFDHLYPALIDRSRLALQSLSIRHQDSKINSLFRFLGHFPSLTELDVKLIYSNQTFHFVHFLSLNPQLKQLSVPSLSTPSPEFIHGILQICPNLTNLSVSRIGWFGDDCVPLLLQAGLSKLENLDLSLTSVRKHDSIVRLLETFPLLKSLEICFCPVSMNTKIYFLNEYALPRLRSGDPELQKIGLDGFHQVMKVSGPIS
jgi:hypothetical protein